MSATYNNDYQQNHSCSDYRTMTHWSFCGSMTYHQTAIKSFGILTHACTSSDLEIKGAGVFSLYLD